MTGVRKTNKISIPKCIACPREDPSMSGECFIAIPSQLNLNGNWMGSNWHLFCGNCFQELISKIGIGETSIGKVDFMNIFLNYPPITIFKEKYHTRIEFKAY